MARTSGAPSYPNFFIKYPMIPKMTIISDIGRGIIQAVDPDQAEEQDQGEEDRIGDLQDLHPQPDQGQVQDQEHDVADVHAGRSPRRGPGAP